MVVYMFHAFPQLLIERNAVEMLTQQRGHAVAHL